MIAKSLPTNSPQNFLLLSVARLNSVFQTVGGELHRGTAARVYGMSEISGRGNFNRNKNVSNNIQQM
jgi:hypothetical protein